MLRTDGATAAVGYSSPLPWPPDSHGQLALPPGWKVSKDQRGVQYYYNKELKVTQWNRPETAHQSRQTPQGAVSPPMSPPPPHNGRYSEGTPSIASRSHSRKRYNLYQCLCRRCHVKLKLDSKLTLAHVVAVRVHLQMSC